MKAPRVQRTSIVSDEPRPPLWIPADKEPEGFDTTAGHINQAGYRGYLYDWNSPRKNYTVAAGWSRGDKLEGGVNE